MATCQTKKHNASTPYVQLTVSIESSNAYQATISYVLKYIATSAASVSVPKNYSVTIGGAVVKSGTFGINGVTGTREICSGTTVITKTKADQTITCSCSFGFNLSWSDTWMGTLTASTTLSVAAKIKYAITYNANGGSGAPSAQTKWYGEALTLSSTKPTRDGHTFQGWGTSTTDTTADYQPGASYTTNAATTLYAIWKANTYKVTYNANGGVNAPAAQTKTYGQNLTLSTSKPTRTNYTFKGWATTANATGTGQYQPGGLYTYNAATTLYAVWELSYVLPKIYNTKAEWADDQGDSVSVEFDWETTNSNPTANLVFNDPSGSAVHTVSLGQLSGKSGQFKRTISTAESNSLNTDTSYAIKITLSDGGGDTTSTVTLTGNVYAIDFLNGGKGVAFGGAASLEDTAHFQWDVRFDKSVYGNVPGMNKLPEIPANDDFNNYMTTGCWAVYKNDNAETIANIPVARAGRLEVWSATGEGIRAEGWSYLRQRFIPYNSGNAVWERDISRGSDNEEEANIWRYYDWHRTTLTPEASKKIYSKSYLSASVEANVSMSTPNTYTIIPLTSYKMYSGNLTLTTDGLVKIGAGIGMVKVSGQVLVKCGSIAGNRHVKIQVVEASGTIIDVAWCCITGTAGDNLVFPFTPIIVPVSEGEALRFAYYTPDSSDAAQRGGYGCQTYIMVEEF